MPEGKDQEKTEPATPKRREDSRKKGQVAQSREIPSALVLLSSLGVLFFSGSWMFWSLSDFMGGIFRNIGSLHDLQGVSLYSFLLEIFKHVLSILMPLMLAVLIGGITANLLQIGFLFTGEPLIPKLSKLNPLEGIKRLFSLKSLVELVKSLFKLLLVGFIAFLMIKGELEKYSFFNANEYRRNPVIHWESIFQDMFLHLFDFDCPGCFGLCLPALAARKRYENDQTGSQR